MYISRSPYYGNRIQVFMKNGSRNQRITNLRFGNYAIYTILAKHGTQHQFDIIYNNIGFPTNKATIRRLLYRFIDNKRADLIHKIMRSDNYIDIMQSIDYRMIKKMVSHNQFDILEAIIKYHKSNTSIYSAILYYGYLAKNRLIITKYKQDVINFIEQIMTTDNLKYNSTCPLYIDEIKNDYIKAHQTKSRWSSSCDPDHNYNYEILIEIKHKIISSYMKTYEFKTFTNIYKYVGQHDLQRVRGRHHSYYAPFIKFDIWYIFEGYVPLYKFHRGPKILDTCVMSNKELNKEIIKRKNNEISKYIDNWILTIMKLTDIKDINIYIIQILIKMVVIDI